MRYEYLDDVVLSPVAVKGLPEEAWERAESSRRVGTTCLVLRDDHSQEGVVMDYVTTRTPTTWERKLVIYYASTLYREYDEHHMWIAASETIQERFTESWWQIRMSHQVMERGS